MIWAVQPRGYFEHLTAGVVPASFLDFPRRLYRGNRKRIGGKFCLEVVPKTTNQRSLRLHQFHVAQVVQWVPDLVIILVKDVLVNVASMGVSPCLELLGNQRVGVVQTVSRTSQTCGCCVDGARFKTDSLMSLEQ